MPRSTTIGDEIAAYLQWRVNEWVNAGKPAKDLAKAVGVSTAQISLLKNGGGAGWKTIQGFASVFGMNVEELLAAARDWAADQPKPSAAPNQAMKRRAHAAELCVEHEVSEEAIQSVLDEPLRDADARRSTVYWILRMLRRELPPDRRG